MIDDEKINDNPAADNEAEQPGTSGDQSGQSGQSGQAGQAGQAGPDSGKKSYNQFPPAEDIIEAIKEIWRRGNASRLEIEKDGHTVLSLSLTVGTIGLIIAPVASLIGIGAALITDYTIKITLDNGDVIDVNEFAIHRSKSTKSKDAKDVTPDDQP